MDELSEKQKKVLKTIVAMIRDGTIKDEFVVWWGGDGASIQSPSAFLTMPDVTQLTLNALGSEGFLLSEPKKETSVNEYGGTTMHSMHELYRVCTVTPKGYRAVDSDFAISRAIAPPLPPPEITESLGRFCDDHPHPNRAAFIMMRFGSTGAHLGIVDAIRKGLEAHGILALRADDKHYHEDLFYNILTYVFGCGFGVAVFERIEAEEFNPNVSLEVGYMMGLRKPVLLLKDRTLRTLHTDLVGKLYRVFDPHDPSGTIPVEIGAWIRDRKPALE